MAFRNIFITEPKIEIHINSHHELGEEFNWSIGLVEKVDEEIKTRKNYSEWEVETYIKAKEMFDFLVFKRRLSVDKLDTTDNSRIIYVFKR
jgi:hypothetical protein